MSCSSAGTTTPTTTPLTTTGTINPHTLAPSSSSSGNHYLPGKRSHSSQSSLTVSTADLRELTSTLHELNSQFKRHFKVLTDIKDQIVKVCEKQESRPVEETSGIHKLERVSRPGDGARHDAARRPSRLLMIRQIDAT
jgi:hypothetical protein